MANFQTFQILSCLLSSFQAQTLCLIATPAFSEQIVWSKYAANNKDLRLPRSQATRHQTTKRKVPFPNDLEYSDPQEQGVSSLAANCRFPPRDNCTTSYIQSHVLVSIHTIQLFICLPNILLSYEESSGDQVLVCTLKRKHYLINKDYRQTWGSFYVGFKL